MNSIPEPGGKSQPSRKGRRKNLTRDTAEKEAATNATNASSINNTRNFDSLKNVTKKMAATNATNAVLDQYHEKF